MKLALFAVASTALLGACQGGKVEEKNASVAEVANAVAASGTDLKFNPGRWESTVRVIEVAMPGMPAGMAEQMKAGMGKERKIATCLTKEQAAKPSADFFNRDSKQCTYDHFTLGGGKIDSKMTCAAAGGARATVKMAGTYSPDRYAMDMTSDIPGPNGRMTMRMTVAAVHVGACHGDEADTGQ